MRTATLFNFLVEATLIGSVLIGASIAWVLPQGNLIYGELMPPEAMTFTVGVTGAIANAGQMLSTFALVGMADLFGAEDERGVLMMSAWCYLALSAVVALYVVWRIGRKKRAGSRLFAKEEELPQ